MRSYGPAPRTQISKLNEALRCVVGCNDKAFAQQTAERIASFYGVTRAADLEKIAEAFERRRARS